jgi:hypothetical protein
MNVGAGLSYSCIGWATAFPPAISPADCPPPIGNATPSVPFAFSGTGLGSFAAPGESVEAGVFTLGATGSLYGWCDLWSASFTGSIAPSTVVSDPRYPQTRTVTGVADGIGHYVIFSGATNRGETFFGTYEWQADATDGSTCTNRNSKSFIIVGALTLFRSA